MRKDLIRGIALRDWRARLNGLTDFSNRYCIMNRVMHRKFISDPRYAVFVHQDIPFQMITVKVIILTYGGKYYSVCEMKLMSNFR